MLLRLLFPPKCVLCNRLLQKSETDLCHSCRADTQEFSQIKRDHSFIAQWTGLWYYKGNVRKSLHRFKFGNRRSYADAYGRLLAIHLEQAQFSRDIDLITWVPISARRRRERGYDQSELLAKAVGKELRIPVARMLKKYRHNQPQSGIRESAHRRANVMNAYQAVHPEDFVGRRILLLDDVITSGATSSECARVLSTANAEEVYFAAVAVASNHKK